MGSPGSGNLWIELIDGTAESFVGFAQFFFDKTPTMLQSSTLMGYPIHYIFLNMSVRRRQWCVDIGHALPGFLPIPCTQNHSKWKCREWRNISIPIFVIDACVVGEQYTGCCRFRKEKTANVSTLRSYESGCEVSIKIWAGGFLVDQTASWAKVGANSGVVLL